MYEAVFFDAFNTLFSLRCPVGPRTTQLPMQKGNLSNLIHRFDAGLQARYGQLRSGEPAEGSLLARFLAGFADLTGVSFTGPFGFVLRTDGLIRRWLSIYADVLATLQALHQSCSLGVISNGWPQVQRFLDLLGLSDYFSSVTISANVGLSKPNPAIFELALRNHHVSPERAIFVDDMPENVAAALRTGLRGLWLVRASHNLQAIPVQYQELPRIHSLDQLVGLATGSASNA